MARNLDKSELHFAQDERLSFKEEGHIYLLDGKRRLTAVSSVIGRYFKPFDSDYWARRKARSLHITALGWAAAAPVAASTLASKAINGSTRHCQARPACHCSKSLTVKMLIMLTLAIWSQHSHKLAKSKLQN